MSNNQERPDFREEDLLAASILAKNGGALLVIEETGLIREARSVERNHIAVLLDRDRRFK